MRNYLFLVLALTGACKWTDFDDLEDTTWVNSTQDPEVGGTNYGVALAGASVGASGGTLAVLSNDSPNYSILAYDAAGTADVGPNPVKLTQQQIVALGDHPVFIADYDGRIGLVERSQAGGSFIVLTGPATGTPAGFDLAVAAPPAPAPDAAVFIRNATGPSDLVFAAGDTIYTVPASGVAPVACKALDDNDMPLSVAGLAGDTVNLWVWTKSGSLFSLPVASLTSCTPGGTLPAPTGTVFTPTGGFMPTAGAGVYQEGNFAILVGHPASSRTGSVFVVDLMTMMQVGNTLTIENLESTALGRFGGTPTLVAGVPDRNVEGVAAGEVDIYPFDALTGALDATPVESLHDAQPESGQAFGRALTTMMFNGNEILVVGGKDEIFAYYRTSLYDHLP